MKFRLRHTVYFLIAAYLISAYFTFWVETSRGIHFYLYLPVAILLSVIVFGTNLTGKLGITMRIVAAVLLILGLSLANHFVCCSGEQGGIGVLFIGAPVLCLTLFLYLLFYVFQWRKKT